MCLEEKQKKSYDDILLNLCLTKDDRIGPVLYKLIPLVLNEILISEVKLRKTLVEIISQCVLRCKSLESVNIPLSEIVENYFKNVDKERYSKGNFNDDTDGDSTSSNSWILYNSTLSIFLDIGFKNASDEEKLKFQKILIENSDKLSMNRAACIFLIIKFIECLDILNNHTNKKKMEEYISSDSNNNIRNDKKISNFVKHINEFLVVPIYCKNMKEIKFLEAEIVNIYRQKLFNNKNYSITNHIKMKKNTLYFLSSFICNHNITYSSYIICSNEKYDEIKDFAISLLQSKKRFLNFNDTFFIDIHLDIIKYFDNCMYSINYIIKILSLFQNSVIVAKDKKYLHPLLNYIYYYFFCFSSDVNNVNFVCEFTNFQSLFKDKAKFVNFLSENRHTIKLKNEEMKKCLFDLMLFILQNTKNVYMNEYNDYIFHLIFCYLKMLEGHDNNDNDDNEHDNNCNNSYSSFTNISTMIEIFFEMQISDSEMNIRVLNKSFMLTYLFFDKLKRFRKSKRESYIVYNKINDVLSALEKYYKSCLYRKEKIMKSEKEYLTCTAISIDACNSVENIISLERGEKDDKRESFKKVREGKEKSNKYEECKNWKNIIVQNIMNLLDRFIIFSDNTLLISTLLKWCIHIFSPESCEFIYYPLLYENCNDIVLSDFVKDYIEQHKKESKLSFDEYIFFITKKLLHLDDGDVIYLFRSTSFEEHNNVWIEVDEHSFESERNGGNNDYSFNCTIIVNNKSVLINNAESVMDYSNVHHANFNLRHLYNLIKYLEVVDFFEFSHVESFYCSFLILDIFLINIVNFESDLKDSYFLAYCSMFTLILKKLKYFLNDMKNKREKKIPISESCNNLKTVKKNIHDHLEILLKGRLDIILNNILYTGSNKLIKGGTKLLTKLYVLIKNEGNRDIFEKILHSLSSEKFEQNGESDRSDKNCQNLKELHYHITCSHIYLFGYLIKKEMIFDEIYFGVLEKLTNYLFYIYFNYIKERIKLQKSSLLKYCITFFYLVFFSKYFLSFWMKIIKGSIYTGFKEAHDEYPSMCQYIASILVNILQYAKENVNMNNLSLLKKVLKLLNCFSTLKDDTINSLIMEDIKDTLYVGNFEVQKMYGWYISHIFLRLDKMNANRLCAEFLTFIFDYSQFSLNDANDVKNKNQFLCLTMFYVIYYNPFLEYINENVLSIGKFFIDNIKFKSDVYSEYCFLGLSALFFSLSIQSNMDINNIHMLVRNFLLLKKGKYYFDDNCKQNNEDICLNGMERNMPKFGKLDGSTNMKWYNGNFSENEKYITVDNSHEKVDKKSRSCSIFEKELAYYFSHICGLDKENAEASENVEQMEECEDLDEDIINCYNNMCMKKVDTHVVEKYVEGVYNSFSDTDDNSFYKNYFKNKEKEVDNNFINDIKKFESRKDHVLKNVYEYINNERNVELIKHYVCLSRYCCSYVYTFLFMQFTELIIYKRDKKIKNSFFYSSELNDNDKHPKSYSISNLLNKLKIRINLTAAESEQMQHLCCTTPLDSVRCAVKNGLIDFKKVNKRIYRIVKYIYKEMLLSIVKSRNEEIKFKIFQHIPIKDVSKTMTNIVEKFLQMKCELTEEDYGMNGLNRELTNFVISKKNDLINQSMLTYLIESLKKMNLKIFIKEMSHFLFFICTIIDTYLMNTKLCITFLNIFKNTCTKYSNEFKNWYCRDRDGDSSSNNIKLSHRFDGGKKNWIDVVKKVEQANRSRGNSKGETSLVSKMNEHEYYDENEDNLNTVIMNLLQFYKKCNGNKKLELYFTDCLNKSLLSSDVIVFDLRMLLEFYIQNREKIESDYNELSIQNDKNENEIYTKGERYTDGETYAEGEGYRDEKVHTESEIFFGKLVKYNNSDKHSEVLDKIISNYKDSSDIEESLKYVLVLLKEGNKGKYILSSISFVIIKLLDRYEVLFPDNVYLYIQLCIYAFDTICAFITRNIYSTHLSHINDILFYLINRIPNHHYIKFVYFNLLSDYSEAHISLKDSQNIRNYSGSVTLYLLKKNYLLNLNDEHIFRDKKRVENVKVFNEIVFFNKVNSHVKEMLGADTLNLRIKQKADNLKLNKEYAYNDNSISNLLFYKLIDKLKNESDLVDNKLASYIYKNAVVDDVYVENVVRNRIETKLTSFELKREAVETLLYTFDEEIKFIIMEVCTICNEELKKVKLFDEENKKLFNMLEPKLTARSFIIKNVKNYENNYYKDMYEILHKRNIFHFYKFFNEYIEEFHIFLDSKFSKDKRACLISIDKFIESFVDIYKCEDYDKLEYENLKNFLNLYLKVKCLFKKEYLEQDNNNYFTILTILKCINFMLLLIYQKKDVKQGNYADNLYVLEKDLVINTSEIYDIFEDILDVFIEVREFEIFQHVYIFLFNIPPIFIKNFNFEKLYKCLIHFINKYFLNHYSDIANYDSNFCLHFCKLVVCVFSYFLNKDDLISWLHFFNYGYLNKFVKFDILLKYTFDMKKVYYHEDIIKSMCLEIKSPPLFENKIMHVCKQKNDDILEYNSAGVSSKYTEETIEDCDEKKCAMINYTNNSTSNHIKNLDMNGKKNVCSNVEDKFLDYLRKFLCILFEISKDNNNILIVIKTFFQFMFYNKISFFQIGGTCFWEKIYNYIYLSIIKNKTKKGFENLMDILNILMCMYNSYGYQNEDDKKIHVDIKINEFHPSLFFDDSKSSNMNSTTITFVFIIFFKIREKSKSFLFPDYIVQNLRYTIMLNYPHFFL
ncbi:conserved Plasmodium protein, unknown function [Plasmodium malariae]|uniref:Uncharacterized protein n=1 Tax=Plasmodium malariae TaxID=5858 RepID=A0A1C3KYW9_PLAMA|nr:conserved Plasmodium protein, unknown function [Plasmodium malariae]